MYYVIGLTIITNTSDGLDQQSSTSLSWKVLGWVTVSGMQPPGPTQLSILTWSINEKWERCGLPCTNMSVHCWLTTSETLLSSSTSCGRL